MDICEPMFDGDPSDPGAAGKLDFDKGLAFQDYKLEMNPLVYEFSEIDVVSILDTINARQKSIDLGIYLEILGKYIKN